MADSTAGPLPTATARDRPGPGFFRRIERHVQGRTVGGLMDLVPLLVTVVVLAFVIEKTDGFIRPLAFVSGQPWDFPGIGIIALIIIFYLVGLIISTRLGRTAMDLKKCGPERCPGGGVHLRRHPSRLRPPWGPSTSSTGSCSWSGPREGMIALGFVTGRAASTKTGDSMAIVYIPTVPNPTSGNMAFVMEDDLFETTVTVEDAMKMVFLRRDRGAGFAGLREASSRTGTQRVCRRVRPVEVASPDWAARLGK